MDCKLGIRSFMEEEVSKRTEPRADLYEKMLKMDPSAPTEEERKLGAITKHRYHAFKESFTSLKKLGFRIEGVAHSGAAPASAEELQNVHSIHDAALLIFKWFLPTAGRAQGQQLLEIQNSIVEKILVDLKELKVTMMSSPFVQTHSFVASSLIFITEAFPINPNCTSVGVHLVDFSRLALVPDGVKINHYTPWELGNHEDGLYIGLDNMIKCFREVLAMVSFCLLLMGPPPRLRPFTPSRPAEQRIPKCAISEKTSRSMKKK